MKRILFVNGNYNDIPLIEAAHRMGLYVITSGNDPKGEGHAYADEYCPCDFSDKEAMLALAKEKQVDYVCSCGNDLCAVTAAYVCEKLGLPGHDTYAVSRIFHEKDEFKKLVEELDLTSPRSALFDQEDAAFAFLQNAAFPQIIKPVDLGGGKGISIARDRAEGIDGVRLAFQKSKNKHIVIEDYIEGTQHGFICYIRDGKVVFDYSTNDYAYLNPFMVWIGSGYPADGYDAVRDTIVRDVERMAARLSMADGFLTIQYMMHEGRAYYLETMRRCLGNLHFKCISRDMGVDLYELFVATECGMDTSSLLRSIHPTGVRSGFMGLYADHEGVFDDVVFDPAFEPCIYDRLMLAERGHRITEHLEDKLGMVWYSFCSKEERDRFMSRRNQLFRIRYLEQKEDRA